MMRQEGEKKGNEKKNGVGGVERKKIWRTVKVNDWKYRIDSKG